MSPEAQSRKQDPKVWGDPTVLAMEKRAPPDQAAFAALDLGVATLRPAELGPALDEPHPSWMDRIEKEWTRRYGVANWHEEGRGPACGGSRGERRRARAPCDLRPCRNAPARLRLFAGARRETPSASSLADLLAEPGILRSCLISFSAGLVTAALALAMVAGFVAGWAHTRAFRVIQHLLSPLLSVPHAAAAFGLAFLFAPPAGCCGWSRRKSPALPGRPTG